MSASPASPAVAEGGRRDPAPALQQWEEVLLLEVFRYLRLSRSQLQQMAEVAGSTDAILAKLKAEEERAVALLARIGPKQREALVDGRAPSPAEQREAARATVTLRRERARAAEEIMRTAAPSLRRLLSREQLQRVYLLVQGEPRPADAAAPALLDPGAGFVTNDRGQVLQSRLAEAEGNLTRADDDPRPTQLSPQDEELLAAVRADLLANLQRAQQEVTRFRTAIHERAQEIAREANDPEIESALRSLARRLFGSPRMKPVLEGRLQQGG
jgi:hypothetical protein